MSTTVETGPLEAMATSIVKTPDVCGGRARVAGTRIRVQDIYIWHELQGRSVDQIVASFPQLSHARVHCALAYFFDHMDEIRTQMSGDETFVAALKAEIGPGLVARR
jgi:uncharacterized protein (DUF433 family)